MKGDVRLWFHGYRCVGRYFSKSYLRAMKAIREDMARERTIVRHRYFYLENSMRDISKQMNIPLRRVREALK